MSRVDFEIRDRAGRVTVLVEAKARRDTSPSWARGFRRNLAEHSLLPRDAMFVLATPQFLYIWPPGAGEDDLPSVDMTTTEILGRYRRDAGLAAHEFVDPNVFEMMVRAWLSDLAKGRAEAIPGPLAATGLVERVRGGTVTAEVDA